MSNLQKPIRQIITALGVRKAATALGVSKESLKSVLAGLDVRPGTIALLEKNIGPALAALKKKAA
jgi:hypothetical protein